MFVLRRGDGMFVAMPGSQHSYTKLLRLARKFETRELAEADKCGNETIVSIEDVK